MIINANALQIPLADKSVHMIVTSPPYWGLRNYGVSGQLGLERTPEEYIANMVAVFRECWRVLRDDGTLWLNIGDSYNNNNGFSLNKKGESSWFRDGRIGGAGDKKAISDETIKIKDLVGIPWRLAFALQADGWYLRSDIIWNKPNPMPESVIDRPTKSHEYLFLLAKRERYYYDCEAIKEESIRAGDFPGGDNERGKDEFGVAPHAAFNGVVPTGRNRRTVWTIPTAPYKGAHFATFPPALVEPCIKAGTSERGVCPKCGKGWKRIIEHKRRDLPHDFTPKHLQSNKSGLAQPGWRKNEVPNAYSETLDWQPACTCGQNNGGPLEPIPAIVFDPFVGSGTTVKVAYDLGRRGVGLDLSLEYLSEQATTRIHNGHTGRLL